MRKTPDILAETVGYAKCNAEAATHDREAWEAHARNCEAALAERNRLREINTALRKALEEALGELAEYEMKATGEDYNNPRINAALKRAEGGE